MAESFDLNDRSRAADAAPQIPTSSSEVAVRTMASDLETMGQSGGMVNQSNLEGMKVPVNISQEEAQAPKSSGLAKTIIITILIILAVLGLFALGYFVL